MSFLYVNENGATIGIDGGYYTVKQKDGLIRKIPKETLESITIYGNAHITESCIRSCLKQGVTVNYFSSGGAYFGRLSSTRHSKADRLIQQVHLSEDNELCLEFAKKIISAKIHNQVVVCRRYQKNNSAEENIRRMALYEKKVLNSSAIDEIMGYEGIAARLYFAALSDIVPQEFKFCGRTRQPPKDAFNSMLSFGYTILLYEIYSEIENRGLSPYIGLMHSKRDSNPALASDLMEEWRSVIVDSVVLSLVQGKEIHIENFETDSDTGGVYLNKEGSKIFINKMENKLRSENRYLQLYQERNSVRRCFYLQSISFLRMLMERDLSLYEPIRIR